MTTMRFFAAARAAVGTDEVSVPAGAHTLDAALGAVSAVDGERWSALQARCSYLVDGVTTRDRSISLDGVGVVDVMPPFAGG